MQRLHCAMKADDYEFHGNNPLKSVLNPEDVNSDHSAMIDSGTTRAHPSQTKHLNRSRNVCYFYTKLEEK